MYDPASRLSEPLRADKDDEEGKNNNYVLYTSSEVE